MRVSSALLAAGGGLLAAALLQYGWMGARQSELRHAAGEVKARPGGSPGASGPMRLLIPAIQLDDAVVNGDSYGDLLVGPGWMQGTARPGESGNSVIAGHRDTFFRHVADLTPGDMIEVERAGRGYFYQVERREIVPPSDTAVLAPTPAPTLTLVTCYPTYWVGPAPRRLIVQARLLP